MPQLLGGQGGGGVGICLLFSLGLFSKSVRMPPPFFPLTLEV
jgi:hypothetical protein